MRWTTLTPMAVAAVALTLTSWAADAAPRKRARNVETRQVMRQVTRQAARPVARPLVRSRTVVRDIGPRSATRITVVRERSFLDPGTEVLPFSRNYTDYVRSPLDYPSSVVDIGNMRRYPLPGSTSNDIYPFFP